MSGGHVNGSKPQPYRAAHRSPLIRWREKADGSRVLEMGQLSEGVDDNGMRFGGLEWVEVPTVKEVQPEQPAAPAQPVGDPS